MTIHGAPRPVVSEEQLDEIEFRALGATREPWRVEHGVGRQDPQRITTSRAEVVATCYHGGHWPARDAEFIAAARSDVPALIAEVRRLRRAAARRGGIGAGKWAVVLAAQISALIVVIINVAHLGGWVALGGAVMALVAAFCLGWLTGGGRDAP